MLYGLNALNHSICAITAYRLRTTVYQLLGGDTNTSTSNFLVGLEVVLGVLNACLPVLKPVHDKARGWIKSIGSGDTTSTSFYKEIPILIQVSQMWESRSKGRNGREELDSVFEMEAYGSNRSAIQTTCGPERLVEMRDTEIHVQKDVDVERASD